VIESADLVTLCDRHGQHGTRAPRTADQTNHTALEGSHMADVETSLKEALTIPGAVGAALVDYDSGMTLGTAGGGALDLEVAAAGNTDVVRAKMRTMDQLGLDDEIEDILITLSGAFHMIRLVRDERGAGLFFYLALDKGQANLAMARRQLQIIESNLDL
jgi:hypothetical protein